MIATTYDILIPIQTPLAPGARISSVVFDVGGRSHRRADVLDHLTAGGRALARAFRPDAQQRLRHSPAG